MTGARMARLSEAGGFTPPAPPVGYFWTDESRKQQRAVEVRVCT